MLGCCVGIIRCGWFEVYLWDSKYRLRQFLFLLLLILRISLLSILLLLLLLHHLLPPLCSSYRDPLPIDLILYPVDPGGHRSDDLLFPLLLDHLLLLLMNQQLLMLVVSSLVMVRGALLTTSWFLLSLHQLLDELIRVAFHLFLHFLESLLEDPSLSYHGGGASWQAIFLLTSTRVNILLCLIITTRVDKSIQHYLLNFKLLF
jgi:hypothetical protein